jgi:hypothetical protein
VELSPALWCVQVFAVGNSTPIASVPGAHGEDVRTVVAPRHASSGGGGGPAGSSWVISVDTAGLAKLWDVSALGTDCITSWRDIGHGTA